MLRQRDQQLLERGLERLAASRHGVKPEEVIARGAGRHAPRAREVRREHAANRLAARLVEQPSVVRRLEREPLRVRVERALDRGERSRGAGRQHELLRFVRHDARQRADRRGQGRRVVRVHDAVRQAEDGEVDRQPAAPQHHGRPPKVRTRPAPQQDHARHQRDRRERQ